MWNTLTIKTPERCHWRRSGVFINFEHVSYLGSGVSTVHLGQINASWPTFSHHWYQCSISVVWCVTLFPPLYSKKGIILKISRDYLAWNNLAFQQNFPMSSVNNYKNNKIVKKQDRVFLMWSFSSFFKHSNKI